MTRVFGILGGLCILVMACGGGKSGFSSTDELREFLGGKGVTCSEGQELEEPDDGLPYFPVAYLDCSGMITAGVWVFKSSGDRDQFASSEMFRDGACWGESRGYTVRESNILAWSYTKQSSIGAIASAFGQEVEMFKC